MTLDNNGYVQEPVVERVVTQTYTQQTAAPVYEVVERDHKVHPGLLPLLLSSLLGLLSLFLPFIRSNQAFVDRFGHHWAGTEHFNWFQLGNGHHNWVLALSLLVPLLSIIAWATRSRWARYAAGLLGLVTGLWLLANSLFRFSHIGFGRFFTEAGHTAPTAALEGLSGLWGRWIMVLAGLALLATALWALLRGVGDAASDAADLGTTYADR